MWILFDLHECMDNKFNTEGVINNNIEVILTFLLRTSKSTILSSEAWFFDFSRVIRPINFVRPVKQIIQFKKRFMDNPCTNWPYPTSYKINGWNFFVRQLSARVHTLVKEKNLGADRV